MNRLEQSKVALIGTSSVGKTTLFEAAKHHFPTAVFVEEAARDYFKDKSITDRFGAQAQAEIQSIALDREKTAHQTSSGLIFCDRSVLDAVVYVRGHGDVANAEKLYQKVIDWIPTYTYLLLLNPSDVPYEVDDVRTESEVKRGDFHQAYLDFFVEKNISYILLSGTLEQRLEYLQKLLKHK